MKIPKKWQIPLKELMQSGFQLADDSNAVESIWQGSLKNLQLTRHKEVGLPMNLTQS